MTSHEIQNLIRSQRLKAEEIIKEIVLGHYAITNIGAILFANDLEKFGRLGRKALRVVCLPSMGFRNANV